ncbi:hypothetical protein [Streptomyces fradiae]|nr:hypothetical protein [Streptomyces fradiae]WOI60892.1 hypothetical protein RYQ63_13840 [Streptomyces fradiae]WOI60925.1 hypothetical protein RYQ63_14010 [Streptomyces fradiae]
MAPASSPAAGAIVVERKVSVDSVIMVANGLASAAPCTLRAR